MGHPAKTFYRRGRRGRRVIEAGSMFVRLTRVRRLIINADDFGLTAGVNRAIAEANRSGVLTSATIMANANAVDEAISEAKSLPTLHTGCHVVLIDGEPVSSGLSSLTNGAARFRSSLK